MTRIENARRSRAIRLTALLLLLSASSAWAQKGRGQLSGVLIDAEGAALGKIQLILRPTGGGAPVKLKSDARGRFSHPYLASGWYVLEADDEEVFLRHFDVVVSEPTGVELNRWESDAHPDTGLPPLQVNTGLKTHVEVVVGSAADRERVRQAIAAAEVAGPIQAAMDKYATGDMEATLADLERILDEQPDLAFGWFLRGVALSRLGRLDESEAALRQALHLDATLPDAPGALGTLLLERGQRAAATGQAEAAREAFAEAAELLTVQLEQTSEPTSAVRANLAMALDRSGQTDRAIELLETLIEEEPDNAPLYYRLADLYRRTEGGEEKALALLERVPETDTTSADVMYNIAVQHFNAGEYDEALAILDRVSTVDPDFVLLHHLRGRIHLARNDYESAIREMRRFVELAPERPEAGEDRQILESLGGGS